MPSKNKQTESKVTAEVLRGVTARERVLHRLHSVALVLAGFSATDVQKSFGDSPRAVAYWVARFKVKGVAGLEEKARAGRPASLSALQTTELLRFVFKARKASEPVNATLLPLHIKKSYNVSLTERQCWRILKQLG